MWHGQSQMIVSCDDPRHLGERKIVLNHGAAYSAIEASKRTGWQYNEANQHHRCPECIAVARARLK